MWSVSSCQRLETGSKQSERKMEEKTKFIFDNSRLRLSRPASLHPQKRPLGEN